MSANERDRVQLRCPECDGVVATVPAGYRFRAAEIVCPHCGNRCPTPRTAETPEQPDEDAGGES